MTATTLARQARPISAEAAAALVRPGDWLDYGATFSQPDVFDAALAARIGELRDVKLRFCLSGRPRAVLEADPAGFHVTAFSWFFSGYDRVLHDAGRCHHIPCNLGEIADNYRRFLDPVDVLVLKTRPMDSDGNFNFGPASLWFRAIAERARIVIVETTEALPLALGAENFLPAHAVDYFIAGDDQKMPQLPVSPPSEIDRAVARLIAPEIEDGSCLQIGVGGMPNAVCSLLQDSAIRDLGVHTEMMTDGIAELYRAGRITGAAKTLDPGRLVYTFALGS